MKKTLTLLVLLLSACTSIPQQYDHKYDQFQSLYQEHTALGNNINDNLEYPEMHKQHIDSYLLWTAKNKHILEEFKTFIENNHDQLKEAHKQHVQLRDAVKILLRDIERNEQSFELFNKIWDRYRNN